MRLLIDTNWPEKHQASRFNMELVHTLLGNCFTLNNAGTGPFRLVQIIVGTVPTMS